MISCKEASRLLSQGQDAELPWLARVRLRLHLAACDACTRFSRQLRFMRDALARYRL
jgi:hypothetical protein